MKFHFRHEIDAPMDMLIELTQNREERDVRVYPNVTSVKILKDETKGNKKHTKIETCANGDIPPKLRKLIKPEMLTWTEDGVFDFDENTYTYKVTPFYMKNVFSMRGKVQWTKIDENKTLREMRGEIKIKVPILGGIAEKKISETQKENLDLDVKNMVEEVKALQKSGKGAKKKKK